MRKKLFIFGMLLIGGLSCAKPDQTVRMSAIGHLSIAGTASAIRSIYLTADAAGVPVLLWAEQTAGEGNYSLYFSRWNAKGFRFDQKQFVAKVPNLITDPASQPKLAFGIDGVMDVVYAMRNIKDNTSAISILYRQSGDAGRSWSAPGYISRDTLADYDRSHFDLARLNDGTIGICWLDRSFGKGRALMFNKTDTLNKFLPKGKFERLIDSFASSCCPTALTALPKGVIDIAYGALPSVVGHPLAICSSPDNGLTFEPPRILSKKISLGVMCAADYINMDSDSGGIYLGWHSSDAAWYAAVNRRTGIYKRYLLGTDTTIRQVCVADAGGKRAVVHTIRGGNATTGEPVIVARFFPLGARVTLLTTPAPVSILRVISLNDGLLAVWIQNEGHLPGIYYRRVTF